MLIMVRILTINLTEGQHMTLVNQENRNFIFLFYAIDTVKTV